MESRKRMLIPEDQCIVVLDASPARNIAHGDEIPAWVATFAAMSKSGYAFSLADSAGAELMSQHARGKISNAEFVKMVAALESFLTPHVPVLLGKVDIMGMIGESTDADWSVADALTKSLTWWETFKGAPRVPISKRLNAENELQDERNEWISSFGKFDRRYAEWLETTSESNREMPLDQYKHPLLDEEFADLAALGRGQHPTLAERSDLQLRYLWRQWVRSRLEKYRYDPNSPKKRNDGIDFDLYRYLMLPALVVADDRGFFEKIEDINSPQREWLWRPQALADAWNRGDPPRQVARKS